jgi:hypothetical protein
MNSKYYYQLANKKYKPSCDNNWTERDPIILPFLDSFQE